MRLQTQPGATCIGNVVIHNIFRVSELDAGFVVQSSVAPTSVYDNDIAFSQAAIHDVEVDLAIIVPCMNEKLATLDGVFRGVPHDCLIILVSNSFPNQFCAEKMLLTTFCRKTQRQGIVVHQQDRSLALAFHKAGLAALVQPYGSSGWRVRDGKGEAMMIGTAVAKLASKRFLGFIDADNHVAGSVHEYCKVYASGLHCATQPRCHSQSYAMVRIKWNSKPKVKNDRIVFERYGRCSRVVNRWMNRMLDDLAGGNPISSHIIQTGNAGDHAMSLDLALQLQFATGYAVEPYQLINAWEQFGHCPVIHQCVHVTQGDGTMYSQDDRFQDVANNAECPHPTTASCYSSSSSSDLSRTVRILQVETRSPHFHNINKGTEHIRHMQIQGLGAIYHSCLASEQLRKDLLVYFHKELPMALGHDGEPEQTRVYPRMETMDFSIFASAIKESPATLTCVGPRSWTMRSIL